MRAIIEQHATCDHGPRVLPRLARRQRAQQVRHWHLRLDMEQQAAMALAEALTAFISVEAR